MSELFFSCLLSNPEIRSVIRQYCGDIKWNSELAKSIKDYFLSSSVVGQTRSETEVRGYLVNKGFLEEEISTVLKRIKECSDLSESELHNTLSEFESFYKQKCLTAILEENKGDFNEIIDKVKEIKTLSNKRIPLEILGNIDVNSAIQEVGVDDVIPTSFEIVKKSTPWGGYLRGQVVQVVAPPGTMKSLFLANEVVTALKNGYEVYWCALGDLMRFDFIIRMTTIVTGEPYYKVSTSPKKYFSDEVRRLLKGIRVSVLPAASLDIVSIAEFISNKVSRERFFDIFVLDYDSNIRRVTDNMYLEGETIYNKLSEISRPIDQDKYRVVFVASQPKIQYWDFDDLPKESAGESSKKQAVVDVMITGGKNKKITSVSSGVLRVAKSRRGSENEAAPYRISNSGIITEIDWQQYSMLKRIT